MRRDSSVHATTTRTTRVTYGTVVATFTVEGVSNCAVSLSPSLTFQGLRSCLHTLREFRVLMFWVIDERGTQASCRSISCHSILASIQTTTRDKAEASYRFKTWLCSRTRARKHSTLSSDPAREAQYVRAVCFHIEGGFLGSSTPVMEKNPTVPDTLPAIRERMCCLVAVQLP